ncbi:MAG: HAD-IA family hydrolase [Candidatus Saccharimonadales bacterium]
MIKAIIFDCFGVLAGSAYKEIYRRAGGDMDKDSQYISDQLHLSNTGQISTKELRHRTAKRLGISLEDWTDRVNSSEKPNLQLLDYVKELKNRYKVAILSNAGVGVLERKFTPEQLNLFDAKIVSAEVDLYKPQAEIFMLTASRLGAQLNECVFIDDLTPYVEAAGSIGMRTILYQNFEQMKTELEVLLAKG